MKLFLYWLAVSLFLISSTTFSDSSLPPKTSVIQGRPNKNCPQFQIYGYPSTTDTKILRRSFYTCRIGYASLYDPAERTPLWVAERVRKINFSGNADRDQIDFLQDPDIPVGALPRASD